MCTGHKIVCVGGGGGGEARTPVCTGHKIVRVVGGGCKDSSTTYLLHTYKGW